MSSEDPDGTLQALRDLVQSEGWKLLVAYARKEYGAEGYGPAMKQQIAQVERGPDRAYELAAIVEKFDCAADAVNQVLSWPAEQMKRLTPEQPRRRPFGNLRRTGG